MNFPDPEKMYPYNEGENAYKEKKAETSCPYAFDSLEGRLWLEGYRDAENLDRFKLL